MPVSKVLLKNAKFVEHSYDDGSKQLTGLVRGDSFINLDIPSEPNPRQYIGETNHNYVSMIKTLKTDPQYFSRKNSAGISIFASACDYTENGTYVLTFKDGDGIANGIHTFHALKLFGRSNSNVKVTIEIGVPKEKVVDIAEALNLSRRLPAATLQNKKGLYEWHKESLGEDAEILNYFEGDSGIYKATDALSFLHLIRPDQKKSVIPFRKNLVQSTTNNTVYKQQASNQAQEDFQNSVSWITKDIHELAMYITFQQKFINKILPIQMYSKKRWTKNYSGETGLIKGLSLVILSGFLTQACELNKINIVVWKPEFENINNRIKFLEELTLKVFDIVTVEEGNASTIVRDPAIHDRTYKLAEMIASQLTVQS